MQSLSDRIVGRTTRGKSQKTPAYIVYVKMQIISWQSVYYWKSLRARGQRAKKCAFARREIKHLRSGCLFTLMRHGSRSSSSSSSPSTASACSPAPRAHHTLSVAHHYLQMCAHLNRLAAAAARMGGGGADPANIDIYALQSAQHQSQPEPSSLHSTHLPLPLFPRHRNRNYLV